ncbi:Plant invertase/pectin methylesterase inhibitor superfamily [Euphorbia peplus]|nr:Plant invertase/pectin methylesterase inhibitor superfamily [Euphorbia peplus]
MAAIFNIFNNSSSSSSSSSKTSQKSCALGIFITLITLLLSSFLIIIFSHNSKPPEQHQVSAADSSLHTVLKTVCKRTLYPSLCLTTLSSTNSTSIPRILESAMAVSQTSVAKVRTQVQVFLASHSLISQEKIALRDCLEMLDQTLDELGQARDDLLAFPASFSNIKTLLSASMTNQHTCIDAISDSNRSCFRIGDSLVPVIRMISNCLSIVTYMEKDKSGNDRRLFAEMTRRRKFPAWMTSGDRILMERKGKVKANFTVSGDGSGDFRLISEAVKMVPKRSKNRFVIKINAGVYNETVEISREKMNIMLIGDGMSKTIITGSKNIVDGFSTIDSATLTVAGDRFLARDLTILNTAGPHKYQAVAARVTSNSAFYRCNFSSYQDTLFAHSLRQFYRECTIQGTIDFIFGNAAAVFQNCLILVRKPIHGQSNMITAQGRKDPNQNTGFSLQNCTILGAEDLDAGRSTWTFLGRPWGNYSRTMVMKSYLGKLIHPEGWYKWDNYSTLETVEYIEHMNYGPGSDTKRRIKWGRYKKNCSEETAQQFTVGEFLHDADAWLLSTGFPLFTGS